MRTDKAINKAIPNPEIMQQTNSNKIMMEHTGLFKKHRYRIAYRFTHNTIRVLCIRHTSMEPKEY